MGYQLKDTDTISEPIELEEITVYRDKLDPEAKKEFLLLQSLPFGRSKPLKFQQAIGLEPSLIQIARRDRYEESGDDRSSIRLCEYARRCRDRLETTKG